MKCITYKNYILNILLINCLVYINGCEGTVLSPKGLIALKQQNLILISFLVMLLVILPVICMTIFFAVRFRESKSDNNIIYSPVDSHSNIIEACIWGIPIIIIIFLSILSWNSAHYLDPSKEISSSVKPVKINVISLNWKWLFIYPEEKIATVNELVIPVDTPIVFQLTSNSVMNSFFIPSLGSQVYTMVGMRTKLNLISNVSGEYKGISSNYSGEGFSNMKFKVIVTHNYKLFNEWIKKVKKNSPQHLNSMYEFNTLIIPEHRNIVRYYSNVNSDLFSMIIESFSRMK